jgi:DNA repair protein RecN (Recombination protein N)
MCHHSRYRVLKYLRVNNIAVVKEARVELGPGLTLFTGETGAGKSILIDALGLVLGQRASAELIRTGETQATVEAAFEVSGFDAELEARGIPAEDGEVIIRREIQATGKGRATVNGALVPVSTLRELGPSLAVIHGQHEPQGLLDPATHLALLDDHGRHADLVAGVGDRHRVLREAESALAEAERRRENAARRGEELRQLIADIDGAHLQPGEEDDLRREKQIQAHAERLAAAGNEAYSLLYEDEAAIVARLGQVWKRIEDLARIDESRREWLALRDGLQSQVQELAHGLRDYLDRIEADPARLDAIEHRLVIIERLRKRHGATSVAELIEKAAAARVELAGADDRKLDDLMAAVGRAREHYRRSAAELSKKRRETARVMEKQAEAVLGELAMPKARFAVQFAGEEPDDAASWTAAGWDEVEFLFSSNQGEELRPLARIASGGELSRILLALKSVASVDRAGTTLVFDEVDTGIGGRVAEVVGRKLHGMAGTHQVLCVSHLPQIAAQADHHYVVRKKTKAGRTLVDVDALATDDRVEEVARMLAGETITDTARRHAREMMGQRVRS